MRQRDLQRLKKELLKHRALIFNNCQATSDDLAREKYCDDADWAASEITFSVSLSLQERERMLLQKIDRALAKIELGSFGECESCGTNIEIRRLTARPFAHLCVDCQEDQEDRRRVFA